MVFDKRGRYRIQAVVEATGVSAPTLRSWERRYGVPAPERTASAYRLYSDDDIALIARMRDLTGRGVAAAEAAHAVRGALPPQTPLALDPYDDARDHIIRAAEAFDPTAIEHAFLRAFTLADATTVFDRVVLPATTAVADACERGEITAAQEHLTIDAASAILRDALRLVQPVDSARTIVLGCFTGQHRVVCLYGIGLRFAGWGFRTICLGPDTPPVAIADAVNKLHPDVVGLTLPTANNVEGARALVSGYAEACGTTPWLVGGNAAVTIRDDVITAGGIIAEDDLAGIRSLIERALRSR
jgi:DNA-binding transcriptional MerR regulator